VADVVMLNGTLLARPTIDASAGSAALLLGHSLFETMLVRPKGNCGLFRLDAHVERLAGAAERLGWAECPAKDVLAGWAREAARAFRKTHAGFGRLRLTALWAAVDRAPDVLIRVVPYAPPAGPARVLTTGVRVPWTVSGMPAPKSGSRLVYSLADKLAAEEGCDEALLVDERGRLAEGAKSNLFALFERRLVTPPVSSGILPGITRAALIEVATGAGLLVEERSIGREEISGGCALFLTNALWGVRPVAELDGAPVAEAAGTAESAQCLMDRFREAVEQGTE